MDFKPYWLGLDRARREDFARRCKTSVGHLNNVAYGVKSANAQLAVLIDRESGGVVPCESSAPQLNWAWAYLRGTHHPRPVTRIARRGRVAGG